MLIHPMDGIKHLENTLFCLYFDVLSLDLEAHLEYNYYVNYVNRKDFI